MKELVHFIFSIFTAILCACVIAILIVHHPTHSHISFCTRNYSIPHFHLSIYNCRHLYCLIEMAIMQYVNGHSRELTNTLYVVFVCVSSFRLNAIIPNDEFIFQIFYRMRTHLDSNDQNTVVNEK